MPAPGRWRMRSSWRLRVPNLFRRLFGEGAFNAAFVPEFSGILRDRRRRRTAREFAEQAMAVLAFWLLLITIAGRGVHATAHAVCWRRASWTIPGKERAHRGARAHHLPLRAADLPGRACCPGVLNGLDKFAAAAAAPLVFNGVSIAAMVLS